jgi:SAM-dependent methyltransferase
MSRYHRAELMIAWAIHRLWKPKRVYDAGCGMGSYLEGFASCGCKVAGCEVSDAALKYLHPIIAGRIAIHDLGMPIRKPKRAFDIVLCIEVAEHVPPDQSMQLCRNLATLAHKPGARVLFSAGHPGQRGTGHINCRPTVEWGDMLWQCGLHVNVKDNIALLRRLERLSRRVRLARFLRHSIFVCRYEEPKTLAV